MFRISVDIRLSGPFFTIRFITQLFGIWPDIMLVSGWYYIMLVLYIFVYIYRKLSPKWKNFHEQKVCFHRIYILFKNFSKIGPIIKKIPNFVNGPLNVLATAFHSSLFCFKNSSSVIC